MYSQTASPNEPIAVVGSACRFPGEASSPSKLWELLLHPRDVLEKIPSTRFNADKFFHPDPLHHGTSNVLHSYVLSENPHAFDAHFFGIKPLEANAIDPQHRILLETVYEALEAAGTPMESIKGSNMAVFVGLMGDDYASSLIRDIHDLPAYFASGTARSIISNRISYFFDLHGPSMTIDTACSSSLVAVHQAVMSLRSGESSGALVAGANLLLSPEPYIASSNLKMLSPSSRSRMWDKDASGYARGDGFSVLVLKTLSRALADHDSIECIIRETGVNQDGRTKGLTMPSPIAQADLIRATYARAGLDLAKLSDRPQYFEAHGTGTPTGDPIEAEAICSVFFGPESKFQHEPEATPLFVGSIKTVIGHTEGTAGLAGLMKASLAIQHGTITPNLLLDELNPNVKPFYNSLEIPQQAIEWPSALGGVRRASVNSFGFGGTNAHAILESYEPANRPENSNSLETVPLTPFIFSAVSEASLDQVLKNYVSYLQANPRVNLIDLSWTLHSRRSALPARISFAASTVGGLIRKLEQASDDLSVSFKLISSGPGTTAPRLLGIFTGQGAQWPAMGARLVGEIPHVSVILRKLQASLDTLPPEHAPTWTLREELLKDARSSRVGLASFSQPLCTAVQMILVDLLRAAKVSFAAVVGHSSGEIVAAYAAGHLSPKDAIRISYYRGFFLEASTGEKGAMLAAGTSHEDAHELCKLRSMKGRICIAAKNSPMSVTFSGDADAIQDALEIMEDEKKFVRLLKVDKAYHSHHMLHSVSLYVDALKRCDIEIQNSPKSGMPIWISSVSGQRMGTSDLRSLKSSYWGDNMVKTVLFSQAVEYALGAYGPFDMILEVGPHPALKSPVSETIQAATGLTIPYSGTLIRGRDDVEAFAEALGSLWTSFHRDFDFTAFYTETRGVSCVPKRNLLKDLPSYPWAHDRSYGHDSRYSRAFRTSGEKPHCLLGWPCPDETKDEFRFKNRLHIEHIDWLSHHQIEGQVIFPASGYISVAVEAIARIFPTDMAQHIEVSNFIIEKALALAENGGSVEILLSIKVIERCPAYIDAAFTVYSESGQETTIMNKNASGRLRMLQTDKTSDFLPPPYHTDEELLPLHPDVFYSAFRRLGYGYSGVFQGLHEVKRRMNEAAGFIAVPEQTTPENQLILHPATLDCALQAVLLAYAYPGDGEMRHLHLPTKIERLCIDISSFRNFIGQANPMLPFCSFVQSQSPGTADLVGDVEIHNTAGTKMILQLQGLHATPLVQPSPATDVEMFFEMTWGPETPSGTLIDWNDERFHEEQVLCSIIERVANFYLGKIQAEFLKHARSDLLWHHVYFLEWVDHCLARIASGTHPHVSIQWIADSEEDIIRLIDQCSSSIDLTLITAVAQGLPRAIRGEINILEVMMHENRLSTFYAQSLGMSAYLKEMGRIVGQLSHRFSDLDIVEIGAGVGAATTWIMEAVGDTLGSYTYTDISSGFFQNAQEKFARDKSRMMFKVLDIEKPPAEQGVTEGCFDVVIASLVLHATRNLKETMENTRKLLRPGGYLIMLEITDNDPLRLGLIFGGLPGWWAGREDGRKMSPCISIAAWEDLMLQSGFSGIDAITPHHIKPPMPISVLVCQAIDDRVRFLREPLTPLNGALSLDTVTIIGSGNICDDLQITLDGHYDSVQNVSVLEQLATGNAVLPFGGTVVSCIDLTDAALFQRLTSAALKAIQVIYRHSKAIIWVTSGAESENPYSNMFKGLQRSILLEMPQVHVQVINFEATTKVNPVVVAHKILQLEAHIMWEGDTDTHGLRLQKEPDITIRGDQVMIPRLRPSRDRNLRYNSKRRVLTSDDGDRDEIISVKPLDTSVLFTGSPRSAGNVTLSYSLLQPVRITDTCTAFLSTGMSSSGERVFVVSDSLDSHLFVLSSWTVPIPGPPERTLAALLSLHAQIVARRIIGSMMGAESLVLLDCEGAIGKAVEDLCTEARIPVLLIATNPNKSLPSCIHLHPRVSRRKFLDILPDCSFIFMDMGNRRDQSVSVFDDLPLNGIKVPLSQIFGGTAHLERTAPGIRIVSDHLQAAGLRCSMNSIKTTDITSVRILELGDIAPSFHAAKSHSSVLVWQLQQNTCLRIQPASKLVSLSPDRSYWLIGLTGGLGLSLCQWMADRGAKHIALSSRSPQVDQTWLDSIASKGCRVRVFASDVTERRSIKLLKNKITSAMPPIAGVVQGAMVLHDRVFLDLEHDDLERVLRPKVDGSRYLDELFPEDTLEFFLHLSSLAYIVGNPGQSAYTAANAFMATLAANRRRRGLAAAVINIAGIKGEGYVARRLGREKELALQKGGFPFISLRAFHEAFAEAILASPSGSTSCFEISTMMRVPGNNEDGKAFSSNPIFQHMIDKAKGVDAAPSVDKTRTNHSIKEQLLQAQSEEEMLAMTKNGLVAKLRSALQTDLEDHLVIGLSPDKLGVDSLVAVDIQGWFRKELGIEIPTLKILNAVSIGDILDYAYAQKELVQDFQVNMTEANSSTEDSSAGDTGLTPPDTEQFSKGPVVDFAKRREGPVRGPVDESSTTNMVALEKIIPMSFAQLRFWFLKFYVEDQTAFNVTSMCRLNGFLDIARLEKALDAVVQRHEALRTIFYTDTSTNQHMQGVLPSSAVNLEYSIINREDQVYDAIHEIQTHVFDLSQGQSLRLRVLRLRDDVCYLVLGYHHLYMDGIGHRIFHADLEKAYNSPLDVRGTGMIQYPDFTLRQRRQFAEGSWSKHLDYWRQQFSDQPPNLPILPLSRAVFRPTTLSFQSVEANVRLDRPLKDNIEQYCKQLQVTPFHFYLAAFYILLFRFTEDTSKDLCIGIADANRNDADVLQSLGLFLNLLPLRVSLDPHRTFTETMKDVKRKSEDAFANSRVPIDLIFAELNIPRSAGHTPLFQAFFNYRQNIQEQWKFLGCEAKGELISGGRDAYDISIDVLNSRSSGDLVTLYVNSALYTVDDAAVLANSYISLLREFTRNPASQITWPALYPDSDVQSAIDFGRGPECSPRWEGTVVERIDHMIELYQDRTALTDDSKTRLTYSQMANRVAQIASELVSQKVGSGSCVGIFQKAGPDWICSFLAVLRTGASCVPLDLRVGIDRLLLITQDCRPHVLLVDDSTNSYVEFLDKVVAQVLQVTKLPNLGTPTGYLRPVFASLSSLIPTKHGPIPNRSKLSDGAVITYTSGSTGTPKGIILKHYSLSNFVEFVIGRWGLQEGKEVVLQQSSFAFDMAMGQTLACLSYGGTLLIPEDSRRRDPAAVSSIIASQRVTLTIATPTEYLAWIRHGSDGGLRTSQWRTAISGGETMTEALFQAFRSIAKPDFQLINSYGPAETTFACAESRVSLDEEWSSAKATLCALTNCTIRIVGADMKPVPVGVPGQVLIGGAGVGGGYLNQSQLSEVAFVTDGEASPFAEGQGWTISHLSGDRGRLNASGRFILEGRIHGSTQVKIGGVRIDLEDIESTIVKAMSPQVRQAVVSCRSSPSSGTKFIVAFVVLSDILAGEVARKDFASQIPQRLPLPQYMRPSVVVEIGAIPVSTSNKVDRAMVDSLPLPGRNHLKNTLHMSAGEVVTESMRRIWEQVLPEDVWSQHEPGSNTDFFHVGGNSLALINVQALMREQLGVSVTLDQLFEATTLERMAALLQGQQGPEIPFEPVDWELETAITTKLDNATKIHHSVNARPRNPPSVIVLTGATGFLGQEILGRLVKDDTVTKVYCLALRSPKNRLPSLFGNPKVVGYAGNLSLPRLGLSVEEARTVFLEADAVVHLGAEVSFLKSYQTLRTANVGSTKELVNLSLPRCLPFHFISTAAVIQLAGQDEFGPESVAPWPPSPIPQDGYIASKWVSEVYLEHISREFGLPILVHRPSSITGEGAPEADLMSNILKFARLTGTVPESDAWRGVFDSIKVETAAKMIVEDILTRQMTDKVRIRYTYESGETQVSVNQLTEFMRVTEGKDFKGVPFVEWIDHVAGVGLNPLLVTYLRRVSREERILTFPRLWNESVDSVV